MLRTLLALVLSLSVTGAVAQKGEVFRARAAGELVFGVDGKVLSAHLHDSLGEQVDTAVLQRVHAWTFKPIMVDGKAVNARAYFSLGLQADFADGSQGELRITEATFLDPPEQRTSQRAASVVPPRYPSKALRGGYGAEVVVLVNLDETGKVIDLSPQSAWLTGRKAELSDKTKQNVMAAFYDAAETAVQQWSFKQLADRGERYATVPITFMLSSNESWHRSHWVPMAREPWTVEMTAARIAEVSMNGETIARRFQLLDALDPGWQTAL